MIPTGPIPRWRSKGNLSPRAQPNELERSKHRVMQALKLIARLDDQEHPMSPRDRVLVEAALHAAHADEAMQKDEVDRAQDHIDRMNACARQLRSSTAPTDPAPAIEIPTDPALVRVRRVPQNPPMSDEEMERAIMSESEKSFLAKSLALLGETEPTTEPERRLTPEVAAEIGHASVEKGPAT